MIRCRACGNSNLDTSQYCDECGAKLAAAEDIHRTDFPAARPLTAEVPIFSGQSATSVGLATGTGRFRRRAMDSVK